MKPETAIVQRIKNYVESQGGVAVKVHGSIMQRKGDPDIRGSIPVYFQAEDGAAKMFVHFQAEVKVPGEEPGPLQLHRIEEWRQQNYASGWVTSVDEFKSMVNEYVKERRCTQYLIPHGFGTTSETQ